MVGPKKILHLIYSLRSGGAENVVYQYAKFHDRTRYSLVVCGLTDGGTLVEKIRNEGIPVHLLRKSGNHFSTLFKLRSIIKKERINLIHAHNPQGNIWGIPAYLLSRLDGVILTEHSFHYPGRVSKLFPMMEPLLKVFNFKILACSEVVRQSHVNRPFSNKNKYVTVYNGIDPEQFPARDTRQSVLQELKLSSEDFLVGNVGSLTAHKSQDILLRAVSLLNNPAIKVIIAGDGPLKEYLENLAFELGLKDRVVLLGARDDICRILNSFDVFVMTSQREGFSISILEAMSCGLPVIATDVGGNKEAVRDGINGFIVPGEGVREVADKIQLLIKDHRLRKQMSSESRKILNKNFTVQKMVRKTESFYASLYSQNRG